jgi:hypothetical protein
MHRRPFTRMRRRPTGSRVRRSPGGDASDVGNANERRRTWNRGVGHHRGCRRAAAPALLPRGPRTPNRRGSTSGSPTALDLTSLHEGDRPVGHAGRGRRRGELPARHVVPQRGSRTPDLRRAPYLAELRAQPRLRRPVPRERRAWPSGRCTSPSRRSTARKPGSPSSGSSSVSRRSRTGSPSSSSCSVRRARRGPDPSRERRVQGRNQPDRAAGERDPLDAAGPAAGLRTQHGGRQMSPPVSMAGGDEAPSERAA